LTSGWAWLGRPSRKVCTGGTCRETVVPRCVQTPSIPQIICIRALRLDRMSGHSKWASIKHKKAIVDSRRGQHFTKLARAVQVAAKEGGGDPEGNAALALAIQKARDASMPKDNIERAIAKGTGEGSDADQIETVLYEGYGPGGGGLLIETLTDNRNRTSAHVRHAFFQHGGNLGQAGSVSSL